MLAGRALAVSLTCQHDGQSVPFGRCHAHGQHGQHEEEDGIHATASDSAPVVRIWACMQEVYARVELQAGLQSLGGASEMLIPHVCRRRNDGPAVVRSLSARIPPQQWHQRLGRVQYLPGSSTRLS